jgi:hypothetical protein
MCLLYLKNIKNFLNGCNSKFVLIGNSYLWLMSSNVEILYMKFFFFYLDF